MANKMASSAAAEYPETQTLFVYYVAQDELTTIS
jgi:hypothetical protein